MSKDVIKAVSKEGMAISSRRSYLKLDLHAEVLRASAALCAEADAGMRVELDAGRIPIQRRAVVRAYLDGSVQEFMTAAERLEVCAAGGENVIPIRFGR